MQKTLTLLQKNKKIAFFLAFFLPVLLAFFIRTQGIITNNVLFLFDNGRDLFYVKKIVVDHKLLLIGPSSGGLQGYFHGVLWYYLLTIPFILGNGNPAIFTLFMAVLSTLSIIIAFFVMRRITSLYGAIIFSLIYIFASFSLATTRFIWNPYPIVWLMPLYIVSLFLFVQKRWYAFPLLAFFTSLVLHFEAIYGITLLPTLSIVFILTLLAKNSIRIKVKQIIISILAFLLPIIPTLLFDLRHHFLITSSLIKAFQSQGATITHSATQVSMNLFQRIPLRLADLYTYTIQSITNNGYVNNILFVGTIVGIGYILKYQHKETKTLLVLCMVSLLSPFFIFINLRYEVWSYYWIGTPVIYSFILIFSYSFWYTHARGHIKNMLHMLPIFLLIIYCMNIQVHQWKRGDLTEGVANLKTQLHIVNTIYKDANHQKFSVYVLTPPVYDYYYKYLFWWQGKNIYHTFPSEDKQKLIYIIREPSKTDGEGTYFKKHTIKTFQAPIRIIHFPGDIVVEKIITKPNEKPIDINYFPQL